MFTLKSIIALLILSTVLSYSQNDYNCIRIYSENVFAGITGAGVTQSKDGGTDWVSSQTPVMTPFLNVTSVEKLDDYTVAAVGKSGEIILSNDKGGTFYPVTSNTESDLTDVRLISASTVIAVGDNGVILISNDNGATWVSQKSNVKTKLNKISVAGKSIFVAGDAGVLIVSADLGKTWTPVVTNRQINLNSLFFQDSQKGVVVGDGCVIIFTYDGGKSWSSPPMPSRTNNLMDISYSAGNYVAVGDSGLILFATDITSEWPALPSGVFTNLRTVSLGSKSLGLIGGTDNTILYSSNGGNTWNSISNSAMNIRRNGNNQENNVNIPKNYSLSQNYPNPFNPSTTINFQLPVDSKVTLKVYDITGRVAAVLVDGFRPAGSNSVEFNAIGFASGVYFYKIEAGSFNETKKLILTK